MRILFLNDDFPPHGSSSVASIVAGLQNGMRKHGHEVHILTTHREEVSNEVIREGNATSIPVSYRMSLRHWKCIRNPAVTRMVDDEMQRIRPDVVHAHNVHAYLTYDALRIARQHAKNVFITMHDVMSFAYSRLSTERFLNSGGKDARLTFWDYWRTAGLQWNPFRNSSIRKILGENVDAVIAVSEALKNALAQHGIPKLTRIHNGMDVNAWTATGHDVDLAGRKVILFGGRLSLDKGTTPLLHALATVKKDVPNVLLLVLGDPKKWDALVRASGVREDLSASMKCIGWVPRAQLPSLYASADVVTTPSLCLDTFNLMNLEAMASCKPVVGTIFGGTPEVVLNNETGFTLDPRNIDLYAGRLTELLKNDALAKAMGNAGRSRAERLFSLDEKVDEHLRLYTSR